MFLRCLAHRHLIKFRGRHSSSKLHLVLTILNFATILTTRSCTFCPRVHHTRITSHHKALGQGRLHGRKKQHQLLEARLQARLQVFDHIFPLSAPHKEQTELRQQTHTCEYFFPPLPTSARLLQAALPNCDIIISHESSKTTQSLWTNATAAAVIEVVKDLLLTCLFPSKYSIQDDRTTLHQKGARQDLRHQEAEEGVEGKEPNPAYACPTTSTDQKKRSGRHEQRIASARARASKSYHPCSSPFLPVLTIIQCSNASTKKRRADEECQPDQECVKKARTQGPTKNSTVVEAPNRGILRGLMSSAINQSANKRKLQDDDGPARKKPLT